MLEWAIIGGAYYLIKKIGATPTPILQQGYITNAPLMAKKNNPATVLKNAPIQVLDANTPIAVNAAPLLLSALDVSGNKKTAQHYVNELHPAAQAQFLQLFQRINELGYHVIVTSGYRTFQEQQKLHAQNSSNAKPGRSYHNYGLALDINIAKNGVQLYKADSAAKWNATGVPQAAKALGFKWGGDYSSYHDPVHFELRLASPDALLALGIEQYGALPRIVGNAVTLAGV